VPVTLKAVGSRPSLPPVFTFQLRVGAPEKSRERDVRRELVMTMHQWTAKHWIAAAMVAILAVAAFSLMWS
jgi:hypothetical protein